MYSSASVLQCIAINAPYLIPVRAPPVGRVAGEEPVLSGSGHEDVRIVVPRKTWLPRCPVMDAVQLSRAPQGPSTFLLSSCDYFRLVHGRRCLHREHARCDAARRVVGKGEDEFILQLLTLAVALNVPSAVPCSRNFTGCPQGDTGS